MKLTFTPITDRVVIKRSTPEEKTKGGIIIPEHAKLKPVEGIVVAIGPGRRLNNGTLDVIPLKPGDFVLYSPLNGTEMQIEGVEYLILRLDDVLTKIESPTLDPTRILVQDSKYIESTKDM